MRAKAVVACIGASVALATALSLGQPASALVVRDSVERFRTFSGEGCETPTVESGSLPRGAGGIVGARPKVAAVLDFDPGETEVRASVRLGRGATAGRRLVEFAAVGSGASCAPVLTKPPSELYPAASAGSSEHDVRRSSAI